MPSVVNRRLAPAWWMVYLVLGVAAASATAFSHEKWATWGATALHLTTGLAVVVGIKRFAPARPGFWWLLAGGQIAYAVAQGYWRVVFDGWKPDIPFRSVDDTLYFVAFTLFIVALGWRACARVPAAMRRANGVDGLVVVLGLSSGTWRFIAQPFLSNHDLDATGTALFWTYEGMELLRMGFLFMIMLSGTVRDSAQRLIVVGVTVQLFGDLMYGVGMTADVNPADGWQNAAWLIGSVVIGAAALHPDMAAHDQEQRDVDAISGRRLAVFVLLSVINPAMTGIGELFGTDRPTTQASASLAVWIPTVLGASVSALLVLRMGMLGGVAQRRAVALDAALREQEDLRAELEHRATHDPLTGLGNRSMLTDSLAERMSRRPGSRGWLLLMDLDGFKAVNDGLGHPTGDALLVALAGDLRIAVPSGIVTRLGGDEFAILLPGSSADEATTAAGAVLTVAARRRQIMGAAVQVSASIGLRDLNTAVDGTHALKDADLALYAAKHAGRDQYQIFDSQAADLQVSARH